jgi:sigma-B regulation protein RsbU (phosphoserine phosphatase)
MLLGLDIDTQYYEAEIQLDPGDTVVFYTDGFTEAANPRGERFEEENLERALRWACRNCNSADDILNYTFDLLHRFIGNERSNEDDMTLVVMRVKPELQLSLFNAAASDRN